MTLMLFCIIQDIILTRLEDSFIIISIFICFTYQIFFIHAFEVAGFRKSKKMISLHEKYRLSMK